MFGTLLECHGVEEQSVLRSRFGFLALHGGLEAGTAEIATAAAEGSGASIYTVVQPDALRWHVPSHRCDPRQAPALADFLAHVDIVVSLHGFGGLRTSRRRWRTALLGGRNRSLAARVADGLSRLLPHYEWLHDLERIPRRYRGVHPANPVNMVRGCGVQLELPPTVRTGHDAGRLVDALCAVAHQTAACP